MATLSNESTFTAIGVADRRRTMDLPYTKEIYNAAMTLTPITGQSKAQSLELIEMNAYFEARYRKTDLELNRFGARQFLELAAGLSPRGIIRTATPHVRYIEHDLLDMTAMKTGVIDKLVKEGTIMPRPHLSFASGNVLDFDTFKAAIAQLSPGLPVAVMCEGLLRYISLEDKAVMANHIRKFLEIFGGVFVTPDIETHERITKHNEEARYDKMAERSGLDVRPNLWDTHNHALEFYEDLGFKVEVHWLSTMADKLVCPARLELSEKVVTETLSDRAYFVMRLK